MGPSARPVCSMWFALGVPMAFRSAPAQNVPSAPVKMATLSESSASNFRKADKSSAAVAPSTAFLASIRLIVTIKIGPRVSVSTSGLSVITDLFLILWPWLSGSGFCVPLLSSIARGVFPLENNSAIGDRQIHPNCMNIVGV